MKIAYVVLRDTHWRTTRRPTGDLAVRLAPVLQAWADAFRMPWSAFRERLDRIRLEHIAHATGLDAVVEQDSRDFAMISREPGWMVVHSDEDDWHDPEIAWVIHRHADPGRVFRWDYCRSDPGGMWLRTEPESGPLRFHSCNWATPTPLTMRLADVVFSEQHPRTELYRPGLWSVHNMTIGSQSRMVRGWKPRELAEDAERHAGVACPSPVFDRPHRQLVALHEELVAGVRLEPIRKRPKIPLA